jgi:putative hemolysin
MQQTILEIIVIFGLFLANAVMAAAEMSIVSARKARLHQWADDGNPRAKLALELANNPEELVSTVTFGITLIGILTGAFGGATLAEGLETYFLTLPYMTHYAEIASILCVVPLVTYLSVIIGELVPKRLALSNPEKMACFMAPYMKVLAQVARPAVRFLSGSSSLVLCVIGVQETKEPVITDAEIQVLVEQGTQAGIFEEAEQEMVEGVLTLADKSVRALMTPRLAITWLGVDSSRSEILECLKAHNHTYIPVANENLDNVLGIVQARQLFLSLAEHKETRIEDLVEQPLFLPESTTALDILDMFRQTRVHVAFVINEYGGFEGLVTINDVLEAIVGEVAKGPDAKAQVERDNDGSWVINGDAHIDDVKVILNVRELPGETQNAYRTLAGFLLYQLQKIPASGEQLSWEAWDFEVITMEGYRIDSVKVKERNKAKS